MTPKDFILYVATMVALYISSFSLIALLFQVVDIAYPDPITSGYYVDPYSSGIRWAIASLFIMFPLYLFFSWMISRDEQAHPEKRELGIRRWLTYITLFFAGLAIAIDLVVLINSFLGGEVTLRFGLKVLVVLVVTGFIFGYYLWDIRRSSVAAGGVSSTGRPKMLAIIAIVFVIATIVGGFVIMGSPATQRKIRFDEQRTQDLQSIQWRIVSFWQQKQTLPAGLADLTDSISSFAAPVDPETGLAYEYRKTGPTAFELCANFNVQSSVDRLNDYSKSSAAVQMVGQDNWQHGVGRVCFLRTIDPQVYPPILNSVKTIR